MLRSCAYRVVGTIVTALVPACVAPAHASWVSDFQAGFTFEDNVGRAARRADAESDLAAAFVATAGWRSQLTAASALTLSGAVDSLTFGDIEGLSRTAPGATISFRHKHGLGPNAPWVQIAASAEYLAFRDASREGWLYQTRLRFGRRVSDRWAFVLEAGGARREAERRTFDQDAVGAAVQADVSAGEAMTFSFGYRFRYGDVTSSGSPDPAIGAVAADAIWDPVFGPNVRTWRLDARTHAVRAGLNLAIGSHAAIDLAFERQIALAAAGIDYRSDQFRGAWLYRF